MKKAMMNFRIPLVFAVLMIPAVVDAESINVWPDQLKPVNPTVAYMQSADEARNGLFLRPFICGWEQRLLRLPTITLEQSLRL